MVVQPLQPNDVLAFRPGLCVEVFDDQTVLLITERERFVSTGASTGTVCRLVDGQRTVQEIIAAARDEVPEPEALYALGLLAARGHLVADTAGLDPEVAAFWLGHGLDPRSAVDALARTPVSVRAIGDTGTLPCFLEALEYAGVRVDPSAAVQVVVTDDYLRPELEALNSAALRGGAPWFLVQVVGLEPLIGPEFRPGLGPCWECLAFWLRNNRPVEEFIRLRRSLPARPPPRARSSASVRAACALGALVISRTLAQGGASDVSPLHARLLVVDPSQGTTTPHAVIARPQCRACGDPQLMTAIGQRAINLQSVAKTVRAEGGARRKSAQQTYRELEHLVSPLTGPVTHLHPWPERHTEQRPVYVSGYLVCPQPGLPRSNAFDRGCAGKGRSNDQAKVSALCEALERFSCVHRGDEARVRASAVDLGRAAIRPDSLLLFSEAQLRSRDLHPSQLEDPRRWIPVSLPETTSIDWAPAWSLHHQERRYVPYTHCYTEVPSESGTAYCRHTGNGVAAGTCVEEALLQAVLELCERDAAAVWWYNRVARPAIDLSSFGDSYFDELVADYGRQGWAPWVLDLTHDLGIPTCVALAHRSDTNQFALGLGCHLDGHIAVERALTELNQVFEPRSKRSAPFDLEGLPSWHYLLPHPELHPVNASQLAKLGSADLRSDVEEVMRRLERAGLELIAVDKSRPELKISVVQAIVPGLRHFWPRFAPGRLYDVPRALGWLETEPPGLESALNPVPLFL